jgi:uncharacterized protein YeaC (DUF1315 family)
MRGAIEMGKQKDRAETSNEREGSLQVILECQKREEEKYEEEEIQGPRRLQIVRLTQRKIDSVVTAQISSSSPSYP